MLQRVSNFCLELIKPSARKVFIFWGEGGEEKRTWLKPSETRNRVRVLLALNLSSRRHFELQAKIN